MDDDLDTCFESVRTKETPIGNFLADLMRKEHNADCAMLNGGSIRADKVYNRGLMTRGNWCEIIPFETSIVLIEATREQILKCLENSVSKVPALEGRFLQVSNLHFTFDPSKVPGQRVDSGSVMIGNSLLSGSKKYKVAVADRKSVV